MTEETMNKYPLEVTPIELPKKQGTTVYTQAYVDKLEKRIAELKKSLEYEHFERLRLREELYKKCYPEEYNLVFGVSDEVRKNKCQRKNLKNS